MKKKLPYLDFIEQELRLSPNQQNQPLVIDLFAGCGGMALGFAAAGFQTVGYEILEDACATYQLNLQSPCHKINLTPSSDLIAGAEVIIAGSPCQPFSVSGIPHF